MYQEDEKNQSIRKLSDLEVSVEGFSGPLDLLCCLVENREVEISGIKISEIIRIYGSFLSYSGKASIDVIADFISAAASLLLEKVLSLLPGYERFPEDEAEENELSEEDIKVMLERYLPYRNAAREFLVLKSQRDMLFSPRHADDKDPLYILGDLYTFSYLWWNLLEDRIPKAVDGPPDRNVSLVGIPLPIPDERQVGARISELTTLLCGAGEVGLHKLMGDTSDIPRFVVTILALLEMSRLGKVFLLQEELFGDVRISYCTGIK